jgi:glycosyltransferase involved in cell wall biosynthesis
VLDQHGSRHQLLSLFSGDDGIIVDVSLGIPGGANPAKGFDPRAAICLRRYCHRSSPVAVVAHGGEALKYIVAARLRVPVAYYAIGTVAGSVHGGVRRIMWRQLVGRAQLVAAVSDDVADECGSLLGVEKQKLLVIPNGRDAERFHPLARSRDVPVIVFVGRLTSGKRPEWFVELVRVLRERGVDCKAQIIGDGPLAEGLEQHARAARVEMLGERPDVDQLLRGADLLVFPSLPEGEGMPGVLIEAGMSGLPVIATGVPGVSRVVDDGVTGSIVDVWDFDSLVDRALWLLRDPARRAAMGEAARARCVELFSMEASASLWRRVLAEMVGR